MLYHRMNMNKKNYGKIINQQETSNVNNTHENMK